jgi:hypothetical protein
VVAIRSELRFALDVFAAVPERRREAKALMVTGFRYTEIMRLEFTYTRVNHLISEANKAIQTERHRAVRLDAEGPPKVRRLRELESTSPAWLKTAIGRPPGQNVSAETLLCWRRAALAIDDYRREHGAHLEEEPLGPRPGEPRAARASDVADRAITRPRDSRQPPSRRRSLEA